MLNIRDWTRSIIARRGKETAVAATVTTSSAVVAYEIGTTSVGTLLAEGGAAGAALVGTAVAIGGTVGTGMGCGINLVIGEPCLGDWGIVTRSRGEIEQNNVTEYARQFGEERYVPGMTKGRLFGSIPLNRKFR